MAQWIRVLTCSAMPNASIHVKVKWVPNGWHVAEIPTQVDPESTMATQSSQKGHLSSSMRGLVTRK